ncbi:DUF2268 domain-containing putative Zn-dependent protease [Flavilitoribacter nigricans]|uniref:DUF2268 domain-containing protein n=1 Tax=Flavilitoribacter nigricans (strain ATCC 23147 / DSM 23189 / NBRC 102662 / NCIMB 1420 / SS-2) TaxID=1122177 RepID=A0A2D0NDE9_FLAN2|nr:DUF2268 domain-containing putative Zn-dependent protease [Flavilitoribacter nigricans]PHN06505.1 hypothetical protein CRP01_09360 [Flavilitoribacter nigricans DSM 23189 = NBRC 102662]
MRIIIVYVLIFWISLEFVCAQENGFTRDPARAEFILEDLHRFWTAFDAMEIRDENPFETYINSGTTGLQDFVPNRIVSAENLLEKVRQRKADYLKMRHFTFAPETMLPYYQKLKEWYPYVQFPPVYFVIGSFNSGGTASDRGLIIGVERLEDAANLPFLLIHESIHFQQNRLDRQYTLLEQAIVEGSADFLAELITGTLANPTLYRYCEEHQDRLLREFVQEMDRFDYSGWLYNSGSEDRPKDIGYWVGYKIAASIYAKNTDKQLAINRILNNTDYLTLMKESELFNEFLTPRVANVAPFPNDCGEVDASLTELTLHFEQPMHGSSFSPLREDQIAFPLVDIIGYSEDMKSFRLKIKLEPDKRYGFKVTGKGFKNELGYPLEDYEVRFSTR